MTTLHFAVAMLKLATSSAIQKNIFSPDYQDKFRAHIEKLSASPATEAGHGSALQPFLSEAESKVIQTVYETCEDKDLFEELQEYSELNFLQLIAVVSVYLDSNIHRFSAVITFVLK